MTPFWVCSPQKAQTPERIIKRINRAGVRESFLPKEKLFNKFIDFLRW
jgi:hypothetical protein